jgi:hypothetical protein
MNLFPLVTSGDHYSTGFAEQKAAALAAFVGVMLLSAGKGSNGGDNSGLQFLH